MRDPLLVSWNGMVIAFFRAVNPYSKQHKAVLEGQKRDKDGGGIDESLCYGK
jgi:hypothetical protein